MDHECLLANETWIFREEDDEVLLFYPESGVIRVLNCTAKRLWSLCDGKHSRQDMIDVLRAKFPSTLLSTIERDVDAFIAKALKMGIIAYTRKPPGSAPRGTHCSDQENHR